MEEDQEDRFLVGWESQVQHCRKSVIVGGSAHRGIARLLCEAAFYNTPPTGNFCAIDPPTRGIRVRMRYLDAFSRSAMYVIGISTALSTFCLLPVVARRRQAQREEEAKVRSLISLVYIFFTMQDLETNLSLLAVQCILISLCLRV